MRKLGARVLLALGVLVAAVTLYAVAVYAPLFDGMAPTKIVRPIPASPAERTVVLVSIDGLAPRVLEATATPTLDRLAREGARARRAEAVLPTITMTNHTTMLTGMDGTTHGITWNRYQPWSEIPGPTLFDLCEAEGLRCGLFAGKKKFAHFAEEAAGAVRYEYHPTAAAVLDAAARFVRDAAADFAFVHVAEVDLVGHGEGWGSPAQKAALAAIDRELAGLLAVLERLGRPVTVLVTADHGGHDTTHGSDAPEDRRIPWILWGAGVAPGRELGAVSALDTAPTLAELLDLPVPPTWPGTPRL